ncbi:MAG: tetratricopeptide repeat protein [Candidatus Polarisedimenticolaceae bacterium]|nr:tetratricopeptide repeat protein [Candidatus Polarisedimenticolaceae bacterium]
MSLLMDALRKAEHAKQDGDEKASSLVEQEPALKQRSERPKRVLEEVLTLEIETPAESELSLADEALQQIDQLATEEETVETELSLDLDGPDEPLETEQAATESLDQETNLEQPLNPVVPELEPIEPSPAAERPPVKQRPRIEPPRTHARRHSPVVKRKSHRPLFLTILLGTLLLGAAALYLYFEVELESNLSDLLVPSAMMQDSAVMDADGMMVEVTAAPATTEPQQPATPVKPEVARAEKVEQQQSRVELLKQPPVAAVKPPLKQRLATPEKTPKVPVQVRRTIQKDSLQTLLERGYAAYQRDEIPLAREHYQRALQRAPKSRDALLGLAVVNQQQGDMQRAHRYYQQILQMNPKDSHAIAGMLSLQSRAVQGESQLKLLLEQEPNAAHLHFALGSQYATQSRWAEAQQAFFEAFHNEPQNPDYIFNLAVSLDHLGQRKMALVYYRRALEQAPGRLFGFDFERLKQRITQLAASGAVQ